MRELFQGLKSVVNTTIIPLVGSDTFTGIYEQNVYSDIMVSCIADAPGTLYFDFSVDGLNTNTFPSSGFAISAGIHEFHTAVKGPRYFRVRFVNDSTTQSYLRLYSYFGVFRQGNAPLNQVIGPDADALIMRSINTQLDIASGRFSGQKAVNKFGHSPLGVQTTRSDIWDRCTSVPTQQVWVAPTTNRIHTLVSSSTADSGGGVGARTVTVYGLPDWATAETSETVSMLGSTSTSTVNKYVIIHRMRVMTTGTNGYNVGNIICTAGTDQTVTAQINSQNGTTLMAIYGIPSTKKLYLDQWRGSLNKIGGGTAVACSFLLMQNPEPNVELSHFNIIGEQGLQSDGTSSSTWPYSTYQQIDGPSILKISAEGSSNDIDATAQFGGILLDN